MMRIDFARTYRSIEQMNFKIAQPNVDFLHLSGFFLLFVGVTRFDELRRLKSAYKTPPTLVEILCTHGKVLSPLMSNIGSLPR